MWRYAIKRIIIRKSDFIVGFIMTVLVAVQSGWSLVAQLGNWGPSVSIAEENWRSDTKC